MILAIDTATDQAGAALIVAGETRAEVTWQAGRNHSLHVMRVLRELMALGQCDMSALTGVVVAKGPGSFNGLRVGISVAKGIAMGSRVPLVGISTLDVIAFQAAPIAADVWAVLSVGRQEVAVAHYTGHTENWTRVSDYQVLPEARVPSLLVGDAKVAGQLSENVQNLLRSRTPSPTVLPAFHNLRQSGYLAELGRRHLEAGGESQLHSLEPLYLRLSAAEERRALIRENSL